MTIGGKVDTTRFAGRHVIKTGIDAVRLWPDEALSYDYSGFRDLTHLLGWPHIHVIGGPITFSGEDAGGQISAYVQDAMRLGSRVSLDAGVRVDRYDLLVSATHASPRINLAVQIGGGSVLPGANGPDAHVDGRSHLSSYRNRTLARDDDGVREWHTDGTWRRQS